MLLIGHIFEPKDQYCLSKIVHIDQYAYFLQTTQ